MKAPYLSVWPPLPLGVYRRDRSTALPFPLGEAGCRVFSRARHALWQGVQALGLVPGDAVLAPAYHHGSEIEAYRQAGLDVRFYDLDERLEPDPEALDVLVDADVRALHVTHFLGFPFTVKRWRAWCDERELALVEDAAQAWLATTDGDAAGSDADLSVYCLYKTIGVPDGGAMYVRASPPGPEGAHPAGIGSTARRHALALAQRHAAVAQVARRVGSSRPYDPQRDFALGDAGSSPTLATHRLVSRLVADDPAARRRDNFSLLLGELAGQVPEPFTALPAGASPFAFPITVPDKAAALRRLGDRGVGALDFWSVPHPILDVDGFPGAAQRRRSTVALPVHQELRVDDVERIVDAAHARPHRTSRFEVDVVDSFDAVAGEWDTLAEASGNIFATREWAETWWRHFGSDRQLRIGVCRSSRGAVAIVPGYLFAADPLAVVRFVGHGPADQLGPICAPADRPLAARALRRLLDDVEPDVFLAEHLPGNEGWGTRFGGSVLRREGNPVLRFDGRTWDEVLAGWSSNLRQQVRRLDRKLVREHEMRYRLADDAARLPADLDTLFRLHVARWTDGHSSFAGPQVAFHREFAELAFARGWLRLWFLEAAGRPVAAWHGFRFGRADSYYQAGRDPSWQGPSVGFALLAHTIRVAAEDRMDEYRFLRGGESFKYRFANADPGLETIGVPRSVLGRAALASRAALPSRLALSVLGRLAE